MLSKWSVKKPYTVVVAVMLVILLGVISFLNMTTDLLPSMNLPYAVVYTTFPGASPEKVETMVTKPVEQAMATMSSIKEINSISSENLSMVILEFSNNANMDSVTVDMRESLDQVEAAWKDSGVGSPMIMKLNPNMMPVLLAAVDVEGMDVQEVSRLVNEQILTELEGTEGVASVTPSGLIESQMEVTISQEKIDALNEKILASIDSDLSKVEGQLKDAKAQLASGKKQLSETEKQKTAELESAYQKLESGREQLEAGEKELESGIGQMEDGRTAAQEGISKLEESLAALQKQRDEMEAAGATEEQLAQMDANIGALEAQKTTAQAQLSELEKQLGEAQAKKGELDTQKAQLEEQIGQLDTARQTMNSEFSKAKQQISSGEKELAAKTGEFEAAREEAFKQASLDGVITADMVSGLLTAQNFSMPAGYVAADGVDYLVKVGDQFATPEEMQGLLLFTLDIEGMEKVTLNDVADVELADNADELYAKVNGNDGVILSFQKQATYSTADVTDAIEKTMEELQAKNPDLHFTTLMNQGVYIHIIIGTVIENLLYGAVLAILVLLLFLRDARPTIIIALSIPISVIFAVAMMYFTGVTLNIISLSGLALGVGMLVDNSIVVIENIYRMRSLGVPIREAAVKGAKQVAGAIAASTLTTICVFLPLVFTDGISKELFTDMGLTIAYSLIASLIVALTLVPTMASGMLVKTREKKHKWFDGFANGYVKALGWTLSHKAPVLCLVTALLVFCGVMVGSMGMSFIPEADSSQMSVTMTMPGDSTFADTKEMAGQVMEKILEIPDVETVGAMIGGQSMLGNSSKTEASFYLLLDENKAQTNAQLETAILEKTQGMNCELSVSTSNMDMSALGGNGIQVNIEGRDLDTLRRIAGEVAALMEETEGTTEVSDGMEESTPEIRIAVDKDKAMEHGLTVAQVYAEISGVLAEGKTATNITIENQDVPVVVIDGKNLDKTPQDIREMELTLEEEDENGEKKTVKLQDIASISDAEGLSAIQRVNQQRVVTAGCDVDSAHNVSLVSRELQKKLDAYEVPEGYSIEIQGESEMISSAMRDMVFLVLVAVVFIYLIMVAQFQSLLSPFIVLFTIPLAFTGGLLALLLTGMELSVIAALGFLILAGIIVNNGIVLVDYVNQLREEGMEKREAILDAARTRLRPILMTAITTILGLFTMALGVGTGAGMIQPMAVVTIGGLVYGTLLTLFVVPALYDIFNRRKYKKKELKEPEE